MPKQLFPDTLLATLKECDPQWAVVHLDEDCEDPRGIGLFLPFCATSMESGFGEWISAYLPLSPELRGEVATAAAAAGQSVAWQAVLLDIGFNFISFTQALRNANTGDLLPRLFGVHDLDLEDPYAFPDAFPEIVLTAPSYRITGDVVDICEAYSPTGLRGDTLHVSSRDVWGSTYDKYTGEEFESDCVPLDHFKLLCDQVG